MRRLRVPLRSAIRMASLASSGTRRLLVIHCVGVFLISSFSVLPFLKIPTWFPESYPKLIVVLTWLLAAVLLASGMSLIATVSCKPDWRRWIGAILPLTSFAVATARANGFPGLNRISEYGDADALRVLLDDTRVDFSRWLLGFRILSELLGVVNLLTDGVDIDSFVRMTSAAAMLVSAIWFISKQEHSVSPWLLITSPMWILFSLGYDEYYPFVAGIVAASVWQVTSGRSLFGKQSIYVLVGVLPILYVGTLPLALALLIYAWSQDVEWSGRRRGAGVALISATLSIEIGGEFKGYVRGLTSQLNLGGQYLEKSATSKASAASSRSFLADPSYALSFEHLIDIFFWLSCGIGLVVILSALVWGRTRRQEKSSVSADTKRFGLNLRHISTLTLVFLAIFYLVFMLPLLGPTRDIDLYFISMFVLLLFAGSRFDRFVQTTENPSLERLRFMQLSAFGFAPATMALVVFGVSR